VVHIQRERGLNANQIERLLFFCHSFSNVGPKTITSRLLSPGTDFPNISFCPHSLQYPQPGDVRDPEEGTPEPGLRFGQLNLMRSTCNIQDLKKAAVGLKISWKVSS